MILPRKTKKALKPLQFQDFALVRREGFEPPVFWSVDYLKGKLEPFRLRFARFAAIRSADFPLFPFGPACFFRVLGQKWVKGKRRRHAGPEK